MSRDDEILKELRRIREGQERAADQAALDAQNRCYGGSPTGQHWLTEGGLVNGQLQVRCKYCGQSGHNIYNP